jgi:hypothetical protein
MSLIGLEIEEELDEFVQKVEESLAQAERGELIEIKDIDEFFEKIRQEVDSEM